MPYVDRQNRICGFLDIEDNETCGKFLRRYFILDTKINRLLWYMDNPQVSHSLEAFCQVPKKPSFKRPGDAVVRMKYCRIFTNGGDSSEGHELSSHPLLKRSQSYNPATKTPVGPLVLKSGYCVKQGNVRKSWKRRYFMLDENSVNYFKCEQDKEPLRSILLKDVLKTHECLVKSGDLLMRDNLFEIITSYRTFYIQAYSPEDMKSWIKEITGAVQALKSCPREMPLVRSVSMDKRGSPTLSGSTTASIAWLKQRGDESKVGHKGPSTSCWLPWMPVPQLEEKQQLASKELAEDSGFAPLPAERGAGETQVRRLRHRSEPQNFKEHRFLIDLEDENIRTSDV
uniref:PH domain-containing protein n=1 Tax=Pseudonaja textilis TaxID=8673 RepID=A0A670YZV4_PSETE